MRGASRQAGFTLMEVLVAVAILAVALGAAVRAGSQTATNTMELRDRAHAGWVADNVLARVSSGIDPLTGPERRSGQQEQEGREWEWELTAENAEPPVDVGVPIPDLLRVEVDVRRSETPDADPLVVRTLWYRPPTEGG